MMAKDTDSGKGDEKDENAGHMLDMSQAAVKKMIAQAKARGYITYDELNEVMPSDQVSSEQIEDVMAMLSEMGINVIEAEEADEDAQPVTSTELVEGASKSRELATTTASNETLDRTDDPVRMYLREMGSVELLSREGEIAIAKRIEAGRNTMISGLCESPLTFQAITIWRDELLEEEIMLRDVIDLETTFGASMDEDGEDETVMPANSATAPQSAAEAPVAPAKPEPTAEGETGEDASS
ncbi:MAG: RNA polymerase sigma factor region1.1 domain-containing protein, partial [Pseudomonadota bacterium]